MSQCRSMSLTSTIEGSPSLSGITVTFHNITDCGIATSGISGALIVLNHQYFTNTLISSAEYSANTTFSTCFIVPMSNMIHEYYPNIPSEVSMICRENFLSCNGVSKYIDGKICISNDCIVYCQIYQSSVCLDSTIITNVNLSSISTNCLTINPYLSVSFSFENQWTCCLINRSNIYPSSTNYSYTNSISSWTNFQYHLIQ